VLTEPRGHTLQTTDGFAVGRLSQNFKPPAQLPCIAARVHAIVAWRKRDSSADFVARCKCDRWEVVVPELMFAP
jgi:ATP-dependent DNA helicase RecQ